jgi:protoporphyrinogen oxidase
MEERRKRVAVLGAGTAALGAAHRLARRGFDVTVAAREPRPGGDVASENVEGFTLEAASPLVSHGDHELLAWIAELKLGDSLLPLRPVVLAQVHRGRVRDVDPRGLSGVARMSGVGPLRALRLLRLPRLLARYGERVDPRAPERAADLDDRSLHDFGRLYFGAAIAERFLVPGFAGDALCDPRDVSRVLFLLRYRAHHPVRLGLPRSALSDVTDAAAAGLRAHFGAALAQVEIRARGAIRLTLSEGSRKRVIDVDAVVVATSASGAARLTEPILTLPERDAFAGFRYLPSLALAVGLRRPFSLHPQLVRVPSGEDSPLASLLLEPGVAGGRVPAGRGLATLRATGAYSAGNFDAPEDALRKELLHAFERLYPGAQSASIFSRLVRVPRALPHFGVGHYRAIARFERLQTELRREGRRFYFAGDYLMDPSRNGALASGYRAAAAVETDLGAQPETGERN